MDFEWLKQILKNEGFSVNIIPGRYNTYGSLLKKSIKVVLNAMIQLLGRRGMFLSPHYIVYADLPKQNAPPTGNSAALHCRRWAWSLSSLSNINPQLSDFLNLQMSSEILNPVSLHIPQKSRSGDCLIHPFLKHLNCARICAHHVEIFLKNNNRVGTPFSLPSRYHNAPKWPQITQNNQYHFYHLNNWCVKGNPWLSKVCGDGPYSAHNPKVASSNLAPATKIRRRC